MLSDTCERTHINGLGERRHSGARRDRSNTPTRFVQPSTYPYYFTSGQYPHYALGDPSAGKAPNTSTGLSCHFPAIRAHLESALLHPQGLGSS